MSGTVTGRLLTNEFYSQEKSHDFEIYLCGYGSRIKMDGQELTHVSDIKIHTPLDGQQTVTIEFMASSVKGWT